MATKQTFESMARNAWLLGLGSIENSFEVLGKSIDTAQEKSNKLYTEFIKRGEEIQHKINDTRDDMEARSKQFFGVGSQGSQEEKLAKLNAKVDHLAIVVANLLETRNAATSSRSVPKEAKKAAIKSAAKPPSNEPAEKAVSKTSQKAETKATPKAKPAIAAKKVTPRKAAVKKSGNENNS